MDSETARLGTRINTAICGLGLMPTSLLLSLSEGPEVVRALLLAGFGMIVVALVVYRRAMEASRLANRAIEFGLAATATGVVTALVGSQWDLITALYGAFSALLVGTALIDCTCGPDRPPLTEP